jgi:adenylate kinase family enzyme
MSNLPPLIMFFGPPTSGKGTQSKIFLDKHPEYTKLDFGHELRSFVKNYLDNPNEPEKSQFAEKLNSLLSQRQPVDAEDLMVVLKERITKAIENGEKLVLDGAGRTIKEAELEADLFTKYQIEPVIFNLFLSKEFILKRAQNRWFVPDNPNPFISYEAAKAECPPDKEPYQREDDLNEDKILAGYDNLYGEFAQILLVYQLDSKAKIFTIDARKPIDQVTWDIEKCLKFLQA